MILGGIAMSFEDTMYDVLVELIKDKQIQRKSEEALIRHLPKALYRKWIDERVQTQLKHERILKDVCKKYLDKEVVIVPEVKPMQMKRYAVDELEVRLEGVTQNIDRKSVV